MKSTDLKTDEKAKRLVYETPAIIYEGVISTRAGSVPGGGDAPEGIDPSDLFGDG